MKPSIYLLHNRVMDYAWGSTTAIPELLDQPNPDNQPQAEMWMGAHPKAPSKIIAGKKAIPLDAAIKESPVEILGESVASAFDSKLPFLFKVLAAGEPLSIQAHPSLSQARKGFARENEQGIPLDAFHRNYRDASHKPELICALTPFWALKGFRPVESILKIFEILNVSAFESELADLREDPNADGLKRLFRALMAAPKERQRKAVEKAALKASGSNESDPIIPWIGKLNAKYPGDIGVLCAAMLNILHLRPGQALYLDAGELHAYLQGLGVEIMANSDNVLRGGLTPKHIDIDELLRALTFESEVPAIIEPMETMPGERVYATPAIEFELSILQPAPGAPCESSAERSVEILLCAEGRAEIAAASGQSSLEIQKGAAVLVPACAGKYAIRGDARIYKATVPSQNFPEKQNG
jgi:mannose-6-phosphate isomerase